MKYIPSLIICALMFLPTPVEGIFFLFSIPYLIIRLFFLVQRNDRDCHALQQATRLNMTDDTDECYCFADIYRGVSLTCYPRNIICLSPFDDTFCSPSTFGHGYGAESTARKILAFSLSPSLKKETMDVDLRGLGICSSIGSMFTFNFERGNVEASSSKMYVSCDVTSEIYLYPTPQESDYQFVKCTSCDICDNGADFKYDCSNANAFINVNNTIIFVPGPKVESCFPVATIILSYS